VSTRALAISSLFVLLSALVIPAWRTKHRASDHGNAVRLLSVLTLVAAAAATFWIVLQVVSVGVQHTSPQSNSRGTLQSSVFGIPVIVIPLAILIAVVALTEVLTRVLGSRPASSAAMRHITPAAALPLDLALVPERPRRRRAFGSTLLRPFKVGRRDASGSNEMAGRLTRRAERTLAAIHQEFIAGDVYSETVVADAITQIDSRWSRFLEQQAQDQASTLAAVEVLQGSVAPCTTEMASTLQSASDMCARVTDRLEVLRGERPSLVEAIALVAPAIATRPVARSRLSGEAEVSVDSEDDRPIHPAPPATLEPTRAERLRQRRHVPTSVNRLRQRAQRAGRTMWTRARSTTDPAMDALRMRFALGEIDANEYAARAQLLSDIDVSPPEQAPPTASSP